ncbi:MAG: rhomboid family intramembrane serine protease [Bacteroidales bacterium]|nr:rhomboid family intramembrane serine protease [Bacteroidales bacterium]
MYQRTNPLEEIKVFFKQKSTLSQLVLINIIVWVAIRILDAIFFLFASPDISVLIQWLAVPADIGIFITRPWTILSYMFLQYDFFHILFNMLWLFWFGKIFTEYLSSKQLLSTYILGGFSGAFLYIFAFNIFPAFQEVLPHSVALGASASVMAIVVAIAFYVPDYTISLMFLGRIKIIYIAIAYFIIDFIMINSGNAGGHIAHIGGALWGYMFIRLLKKGNDMSKIFDKVNLKGFFNFFLKEKKPKFQNVYTNNSRPMTDEDYNFEKSKKQEEIDKILEKISKSGYQSLTKKEKEFLFKVSNKK